MFSISEFLNEAKDTHRVFNLFKELSHKLKDPHSQDWALEFLHKLKEECPTHENFSFVDVSLSHKEKLTLLQLPSIFMPEEWSYTFFEGIRRIPREDFSGKILTELGSGNGWISLALAKHFYPHKIYGLDINPKATLCSRINLYLNSFDKALKLKVDKEGKSLLDRVEFHTSDLLQYLKDKNIHPDRVLGCIPQVLSPDPERTASVVHDQLSDEDLFDLSNYCGLQGHLEDQFGLGLVARAVEESVSIMPASGRIILNLGGRPSKSVLTKLFTRRGLHVETLWQKKVEQASDTDISPLVEIERKTPHKFEFFLSKNQVTPISARLAQECIKEKKAIFHSLTVFSAKAFFPLPLQELLQELNAPQNLGIRNGLDLSYEDQSIIEEKVQFLAHFIKMTKNSSHFAYGETAGLGLLRNLMSKFLQTYHHLPLDKDSLLVAPGRKELLSNICNLLNPDLTFLSKNFRLPQGLSPDKCYEIPDDLALCSQLMETLKPSLVILALDNFSRGDVETLKRIFKLGADNNCFIVVDLSHQIELNSSTQSCAVFDLFQNDSIPGHVCFLIGLVQNKVYNDLHISFLLSENKTFLKYLENMSELSFSRAPLIAQHYYLSLLSDLLSFQMPQGKKMRRPIHQEFFKIGDSIVKAFEHPSLKANDLAKKETLRMDYGENELAAPSYIFSALLESFGQKDIFDGDPREEIKQIIKDRYGLNSTSQQLQFALGVAPIFSSICQYLAHNKIPLAVPSGMYGQFRAMVTLNKVQALPILTEEKNSFKMTSKDLKDIPQNSAVYLNAPVVNPTGAIYHQEELDDIFDILVQKNCIPIIDTIFSGLEFKKKSPLILKDIPSFLMGGISKEFSAAGLRFGFLRTNKLFDLRSPHPTILASIKKLYQYNTTHSLAPLYFSKTREVLSKRAQELSEVLIQGGWHVLPPQGGLFLVARPTKKMKNTKDLAKRLFEEQNVLINSPEWTQLPDYYRFVLSLKEDTFQKCLEKLRIFHNI